MRALSALLLALVLIAGLANALVPATCSGDCATGARSPAFLAPVATISSGSSMRWVSQDTVHEVADGATVGSCLDARVPSGASSAAVVFVVAGGALHAQTHDAAGNLVDRACTTAERLPDGSYALPYRCLIHPEMRGVLVVTP